MDFDQEQNDQISAPSSGVPERPLPPPPTFAELIDTFRQRMAMRHPRWDMTRLALVLAALVGVGGMAWVSWGNGSRGDGTASVTISHSTAAPSSTSIVTSVAGPTSTLVPATLVVDVAGAVVHPGPVRVASGSRISDALRAAGGPGNDADLERVDRAAMLTDGERVYVPHRGQADIPEVVGATGSAPAASPNAGEVTGTGSASAGSAEASASAPVDLNMADETALETLPGVGPATAKAILDYRTSHGRFSTVDDLLGVKGIGPAKLAKLRPFATV